MAQYRYQIKGQNGQTLTGILAADSVASAATVLRNQGRTFSRSARPTAAARAATSCSACGR
ncbi:MAG: hypothetical protein QM783_13950 [Phycisphaerales bacterium]